MRPLRASGPFIYEEGNPNVIAQIYIQHSAMSADAVEAISRLFAASEEMHRALVVALHSMERADEPGSPAREAAIEQARAAISKKEGR